jgi:WS/DGAT/MGAT family acyltransferase
MGSPLRTRMSGVDHAWLLMETPASPMVIVGLLVLEGRLGLAALKRTISSRFLAFPRFRRRPVSDASGAGFWELDPAFDLDAHVVAVRLPGAAGQRELERLVGRLASRPLDPSRPLWQFHLVENYHGGSAVVARIHHCHADGIALVRVMLSMTGATAAESRLAPAHGAPEACAEAGWADLLAPLADVFSEGVPEAWGRGLDVAAQAAKLAAMGRDADSRLKRPLSGEKRVGWAQPIPLDEVKAVASGMDCSVNDVLVSCAAGALREHLAAHGDRIQGEPRAVVPVNLRPAGAVGLGNRFGLVFLDLPLVAHPLERLYEVRRRMAALKGSRQPAISLALLAAVGIAPRLVQDAVTRYLGRNASVVVTNVPGPREALYLGGQRLAEVGFWVPQAAGIGLGLSILSFDGRVGFGVMADAALVPDPARLASRFNDEFARLLWIALMSPWGANPPRRRRAR